MGNIDPAILDRNTEILRNNLLKEMKSSLDFGNRLIDEEMNGLSMIARPIVKAFYAALVRKDLEEGTVKTINGTLKIARRMIDENISVESPAFYQLLDEKFPGYLKNDQTSRQCKHSHKNFPRLSENLKKTFEWQVRPLVLMLQVTDPTVSDYPSIVRRAYKNADESKTYLANQMDPMQKGLEIIKEDMSILDIPTARDFIFRILTKGFAQKRIEYMKDIDSFFA